jgi:hypothetical protein
VIANVLGLHEQRRPLVIREKTSSFNEENLARLAWEQSSCDLRTDLESDMHVYIHMSSIREWTHTTHVDYCFEGAQSSATHALNVERVCWDGISDTQSSDDMLDVVGPSQDTACILRSPEDAHLELVLG